MNKIRIIDLLNKIANNDLDTPDYIEFFDRETSKSNKMMVCEENIIYYMNRNALFLNDEVEILKEEKKIPEKLNLDTDDLRGKETPRAIDYLIEDKINQLIDYLKSKGE